MSWWLFFTVFIITAITDGFWAMYFIAMEKREATQAAFWSSLIMLCMAVNVVSYVESKWYILPAVLGAFVGTYFIVKYKKK